MEGSVFCINNCNSPTFHGVMLALLTVNEVSYRMLWGCLFIQHLLEPYCVPQTQCRVDGTEPSERHKPGQNQTSVQKLAPIFTRGTPGIFHGLVWPCFPHLYKRIVKKEKKKGGTSLVVQWLRLHLPLKKAQVRSHIPTMWRIMMLCGEPYKFTQHLPGACRGGETRPVGKQDYRFSPFLTFSVKVSWKKWPQGWDPHGQGRVG